MRTHKDDLSESDYLREWIVNYEEQSAPEGFTHNVMSRIALETIHDRRLATSFPGPVFRIVALIVFSILILMAFLVPSIDSTSLPSFLLWLPDFSRISLNLNFPEFQLFNNDLTLMYISIGIFLIVLLNIFIERFRLSEKK